MTKWRIMKGVIQGEAICLFQMWQVLYRLILTQYQLEKAWKDPHRREAIFYSKCDKLFQNMGNSKNHEMTHTGEKPFVCSKCDKWFVQSSGLKTHQRIDEVEEPFTCTKCGMSFTQNRVLTMHKRIHTGEKLFAWSKCEK